MFEAIFSKIQLFDFRLTNHIYSLVAPYLPPEDVPFLSQRIPLFVKLGFYSFVVLIPALIAKVKYEEKAIVTLVVAILLLIIGLSIITTFFGFFQLLYTYP